MQFMEKQPHTFFQATDGVSRYFYFKSAHRILSGRMRGGSHKCVISGQSKFKHLHQNMMTGNRLGILSLKYCSNLLLIQVYVLQLSQMNHF